MLPPRPAKSIDAVRRLPEFGKIGLSTVLCTKLGVTLLMVRCPPSPSSSESRRYGFAAPVQAHRTRVQVGDGNRSCSTNMREKPAAGTAGDVAAVASCVN